MFIDRSLMLSWQDINLDFMGDKGIITTSAVHMVYFFAFFNAREAHILIMIACSFHFP